VIEMVKRIFLALDDGDFEQLKAMKEKKTWEEFLVKPHLEKEASDG